MSFEIPVDLIKQVQISLRNEAKISSYDPDNPSLPTLPRVEQSIAELDPSPPYLRCNNCKGRLLRGVHSLLCVFCGTQQQNQQLPPEPLNFNSTFGYQWFLQSLDLDGSEIIEQEEEKKEKIPLSSFLDLEIKWIAASNDTNKKSAFNLFENVVKPTSEITTTDSFSGWEADFQSVDSSKTIIIRREDDVEKDHPLFVGSSVDISAHMDSVFGSAGKVNDDDANDDWFQDDLLRNSASSEITANVKDSNDKVISNKTIDEDNGSFDAWNEFTSSSSANDRLSSNKEPDNKTVDKEDDSFDVWNDFTSSTGGQDPSNGSSRQTVSHVRSSNEALDNKTVDEDNDSFEVWNDFTSSTGAQDPFNGSSKQTVNYVTSSNEAPDNKTVDEENDSFEVWNDFSSSTGAQDPSNGSSKLTVNYVTSSNEAPDTKTNDQDDDSFDAWNDFTSSTSAQDSSIGSSKQTVSQLTSSNKEPDNKTIDQFDDSYDAWNDFTSSTSAQDPFNSSWKQTVNPMIPSFKQNSETNLFSTINNLQDIDFGSFSQQDFYSGALSNQNGSIEVKSMQSEASVSDRMGDARDGGNAELVPKGEDVSNPTTGSKIDDIEMLMSQMHDLSFMLQSNLSIPSKQDGFNAFSKE